MCGAGNTVALGGATPPVRRLGLASRGNAELTPDDIHRALSAGVGYLNWCGQADSVSEVVSALPPDRRDELVIATQIYSRGGIEARQELAELTRFLGSSRLDVGIFYYVESEDEWAVIARRDGALDALRAAQSEGALRLIGLTTHDLHLAARLAGERAVDLLMIRYNAADRGAEDQVFPRALANGLPVVAYTCLRWGALLRHTPEDEPGYTPPRAPEWYRWVLENPAVSLAICAPDTTTELAENLSVLACEAPLTDDRRRALEAHGERVRRYTSTFR